MSYYNSVYGVPMGYQQPYVPQAPGQFGSYVTPTTTAQQMMAQQQMQQPVMQQPVQQVVQQPVVQQPVVSNASFNGIIVNDFEDVKNYPVPIGGLTLLLNKKDKKFYIKSLNDNGVPVIETYNFDSATNTQVEEVVAPVQQNNTQMDTIEKRLSAIEYKLKIE